MRGKLFYLVLFLCSSVLVILALALISPPIAKPPIITPPTREDISYSVHFISIVPEIDGKLDEPVWQSLPEVTGFYVLGGDVAEEKQTFFRMAWDKDNLYIGIRSEELDILEVIGIGSDGDPLWTEDSVEIFLAPAFPTYFQLVVNTIGSRIGTIGRSTVHTIEFWEAQSYRGDDFWSTEIKIPFVSLDLDGAPQDGEIWRGNITRNITVFTSGGDRHTTWAPLEVGFHEPGNFDFFIFNQRELPVKEVRGKDEISNPFVGVTHIHRTRTKPRPLSINILVIDLTAPGISFRVTPSNGIAPGETDMQTVRDFLVEHNA